MKTKNVAAANITKQKPKNKKKPQAHDLTRENANLSDKLKSKKNKTAISDPVSTNCATLLVKPSTSKQSIGGIPKNTGAGSKGNDNKHSNRKNQRSKAFSENVCAQENIVHCEQSATVKLTEEKPKKQRKYPIVKKPLGLSPGIVIKEEQYWARTCQLFKEKGYKYNKSKSVNNGMRIYPHTKPDYNRMENCLKENLIPYTLQEEKDMKVIIKGLSIDITNKELEDILRKDNIVATSIYRFTRKDGSPSPTVLVILPKQYVKIFCYHQLMNSTVAVEIKSCSKNVESVGRNN